MAYLSRMTFVGVSISGHHRNTFVWPQRHFMPPPPALVASHVIFAGTNNEGHGRVSSHGRVWRQLLRHGVFVVTFAMFGFSLFSPLLFCLNLDLNHFFFSNLIIFGIYCGCSTSLYVHCSFLGQLFSLVLNLSCVRKSTF